MCNMKWVFSRSKHRLLTRIFAYIIYTMYVFLFGTRSGVCLLRQKRLV